MIKSPRQVDDKNDGGLKSQTEELLFSWGEPPWIGLPDGVDPVVSNSPVSVSLSDGTWFSTL